MSSAAGEPGISLAGELAVQARAREGIVVSAELPSQKTLLPTGYVSRRSADF